MASGLTNNDIIDDKKVVCDLECCSNPYEAIGKFWGHYNDRSIVSEAFVEFKSKQLCMGYDFCVFHISNQNFFIDFLVKKALH